MGKGPEQTIFKRKYRNGQQVHEKVFNITNRQEMQIETTMRYYLLFVTKAVIKETRENEC